MIAQHWIEQKSDHRRNKECVSMGIGAKVDLIIVPEDVRRHALMLIAM